MEARVTYDPTQSKGTSAWQRSVEQNRENNERLKRQGLLP